VSGHSPLNILVKISITKSARPANRSEILHSHKERTADQDRFSTLKVIGLPQVSRLRSLIEDRPPAAVSGRAFSSSASPFQRQSLERPFLAPRERSPSNNRHFYSGRRRFHRRPPFIVAAKTERLGRAGVCSPPARRRLSRLTRPCPWPLPPARPRNERARTL
jgi:hypothetical protein